MHVFLNITYSGVIMVLVVCFQNGIYDPYSIHRHEMIVMFSFPQLIQTISAVDKDDPLGGQKFFFSLAAVNPNFTVQDNEGHFCTVFIQNIKK
jgi:hypothetical protein